MSSIEWGVHVLAFAAGLALFAATSFTVVTTMVVPRPTRTRISHLANWLTMSTFRFMANRRAT